MGSVVALMGTLGWADATTPPAPAPAKGAGQPCKEIEQACTSAGFVKGEAKEGKGLFKNCLQPILKGQAVEGVTVDPAVVSACKDRMAKRRARRQSGQGNPGGGNAPANAAPSGSKPNGDSGNSSGE